MTLKIFAILALFAVAAVLFVSAAIHHPLVHDTWLAWGLGCLSAAFFLERLPAR
jgi:hypothetical protein